MNLILIRYISFEFKKHIIINQIKIEEKKEHYLNDSVLSALNFIGNLAKLSCSGSNDKSTKSYKVSKGEMR